MCIRPSLLSLISVSALFFLAALIGTTTFTAALYNTVILSGGETPLTFIPSAEAQKALSVVQCFGKPATFVGTEGFDYIEGKFSTRRINALEALYYRGARILIATRLHAPSVATCRWPL